MGERDEGSERSARVVSRTRPLEAARRRVNVPSDANGRMIECVFRWRTDRRRHPAVVAATPANRSRLQATLAAFAALAMWWLSGRPALAVMATFLALAALVAWIAPARYRPFQSALDAAIHALLVGVSWTLLAVVYFGLFTPIRAIASLLGRDPLGGRRAPAGESYLTPLPPGATGRFDRQF